MQDYVVDLLETVERAAKSLLTLGEEASARRPAPGKWSPREIIGHLIDSASNNHQRFVRAQLHDDMIFPGYEQDAWVETQRYHDGPWADLVGLWAGLNRHMARVMAAAPEDLRMKPRARHNLQDLAFHAPPPNAPATLDYFMRDYVGHLQHHLRQIPGAHID